MSHWPILPILVPLATAILCLLWRSMPKAVKRTVATASVLTVAAAAVHLLLTAGDGTMSVYRLGNWPAPYGIILVVDRLSAMMVALVAALAGPVLLHAMAGDDSQGRHFHPLFQLQIVGLNGAFLTGDLFNLFVFFEVLLLASYVLLMQGGGRERARAGLAYVVLNLAGSALFLIALGLLYGTLGTLNIADMAVVIAQAPAADQALIRTAAALLISVFLLKAALLPLSFWLPHVYGAALASVAALFAIMTKVGVYALLRVFAIVFAAAPFTADLLATWLPVLALLTIAMGAIGALAATRFATLVANLVLISTGTLLAAIPAGMPGATAAALYYLPHTTLVTAGLFLLGSALAGERGDVSDSLAKGPALPSLVALGGAYLVLGLAVSGVPPLSGFLGKLMIMQSVQATALAPAIWAALLASGLVVALVLARGASVFFWEPGRDGTVTSTAKAHARPIQPSRIAIILLVSASLILALAAAPVGSYARAAAEQLHARSSYLDAVLGTQEAVRRERRP